MKEFFLILFFAKSVALTPEPIDIVSDVTFELAEPVSAITSGAHVRIDVSRTLPGNLDASDPVAVLDYLSVQFPDGSVSATLTTGSGQSQILDRVGGASDGTRAELMVSSSTGVETGTDFSELTIETTVRLNSVTVVWQNHAK